MTDLMEKIIIKRHSLILERDDLIRVFTTLDKFGINRGVAPRKLDWDGADKWMVEFVASEEIWRLIRNDLEVIRAWDEEDIPIKCVGLVYSTD